MYETLARAMLSPGAVLTLTCRACGRTATLSRREAFERFGSDASPYLVRRRARCGRCGERDRVAAAI
jgi:hypothetical protein